ncbi:hypothetical protein GCM10022631_09660 [Deinococcus rubellus]
MKNELPADFKCCSRVGIRAFSSAVRLRIRSTLERQTPVGSSIWRGQDQIGFDAYPVVPFADPQPGYQVRVTATSVRQQVNIADLQEIKQALDLGQDREQMSCTGLGAGMVEDTRDERRRAS